MKWWNKDPVVDLFKSEKTKRELQTKFPYILHLHETEDKTKLSNDVKQMLISYLIYRCGSKNVSILHESYKPDIDIKLYNRPIGIKVHIGELFILGLKLTDTLDIAAAQNLIESYLPSSDLIVIHINKEKHSGIYFIPRDVQLEVFNLLGRKDYFVVPTRNEVRISPLAISEMLNNANTVKIDIDWATKHRLNYGPYAKWIGFWKM